MPAATFSTDVSGGRRPGAGWWVASVHDLTWQGNGPHAYTAFAQRSLWTQYGLSVDVLQPGAPNGMYHREHHADESFLVLHGTAEAIVEGAVVPMGPGDLLHCPAGTAHILVAADQTATVFMLGARGRDPEGAEWGEYVPDPEAAGRGAGVERRTTEPDEAYADWPGYAPVECPIAWAVGGPSPQRSASVGPARFVSTAHGLRRSGEGWFVANLDGLAWEDNGRIARLRTDGDVAFTQYGLNLRVARPGCPTSMYHREHHADETFVLLDGEGVAVIEGHTVAVAAGDVIHLPAGTAHSLVGAAERGVVVLMTGARFGAEPPAEWGEYVPDEAAGRLGAAVPERTTDPHRAYAQEPAFAPADPLWTFARDCRWSDL